MGKMLVYTRPSSPEREDEYNEWYDTVHLPEVCAVEPFTGAQRARVSSDQMAGMPDPDFEYLAIYDFEGTGADAIAALMGSSGGFTMSDALDQTAARVVVVDDHGVPYSP